MWQRMQQGGCDQTVSGKVTSGLRYEGGKEASHGKHRGRELQAEEQQASPAKFRRLTAPGTLHSWSGPGCRASTPSSSRISNTLTFFVDKGTRAVGSQHHCWDTVLGPGRCLAQSQVSCQVEEADHLMNVATAQSLVATLNPWALGGQRHSGHRAAMPLAWVSTGSASPVSSPWLLFRVPFT